MCITMKTLSALTLVAVTLATSAPASNLISKACLKSGRPDATRQLCVCIQRIADTRLKRQDQRLAASFFKNPHKAQVIRQSDRPAYEVFWTRYKEFGNAAEKACAGANG